MALVLGPHRAQVFLVRHQHRWVFWVPRQPHLQQVGFSFGATPSASLFGAAPASTAPFGSSATTPTANGLTFGTTTTEPTYELAEKDFSENQASRDLSEMAKS